MQPFGHCIDRTPDRPLRIGYLSPDFVTDPDRMEAVLESPYILIHEDKISNMKDLLPVLELVARTAVKRAKKL